MMTPAKQGLYDPQYEHDACGVGFVVDLKGRKSHDLVQQALQILVNLEHRGACGCEKNTGDGAGILMQMPHAFLAEECDRARDSTCPARAYGVGMVFLPTDAARPRDLRAALRGDRPRRGADGPRLAQRAGGQCDDRADGQGQPSPLIRQVFIALRALGVPVSGHRCRSPSSASST